MPIDPQARVLLDQLDAAGTPPLPEIGAEQARQLFAGTAALARPTVATVRTDDRSVPGPGGDIPVRVYHPEAADGPLPLVVYCHGGGFVIGGIDTHDPLCRQLAASIPAVVVSVDYRLAPEHRFPAAVEDAVSATEWAAANASTMGADPARLVVAGDSAGGNLAAVVARHARHDGGPDLAMQVLIYPATDLTRSMPSHVENGAGYFLTTDTMEWFSTSYMGDDGDLRHPDASPLFADDLRGLAPALVVTAEFDPLRDEGEAYAHRLEEAGVPVDLVRYDGMIHGFVSMDAVIDTGAQAIGDIAAAVRSRVGGGVAVSRPAG